MFLSFVLCAALAATPNGQQEVPGAPADGAHAPLRQLRLARRTAGRPAAAAGAAAGAGGGGPLKLPGRMALALQGGGWHSVNAFAGVTAGLLAAFEAQHGTTATPSLASTQLFKNISAVSSVSGGTWFFASLAYSGGFADLVDSMAADPASAESLWEKGWVSKLMAKGVVKNKFENLLGRVSEFDSSIEKIRAFEMARETGYFWSDDDGDTWASWIGSMLQTTAGIPPDTRLGSDTVAPWAMGKIWLLDHSIIAGSKDDQAQIWSEPDSKMSYYMMSRREPLPTYIPAIFSVTLGAGGAAPAPLSYASETALESMKTVQYTSGGRHKRAKAKISSAKGQAEFAEGYDSPGSLSLHGTVAASSAAGGAICLSPFLGLANQFLGVDFTVWLASSSTGSGFKEAEALICKKAPVADVAKAQVRAVIDGGYTDNTAIAHLVANGATEVISLLDIGEADYSHSICYLFNGGPVTNGVSGSSGSTFGVPLLHFQIFEESADDIKQQLLNLPKVRHPGSKKLKHLSIGTITGTTVDNEWFGTKAGEKVTIHIVSVSSLVWVGGLEDFPSYKLLVGEIVAAMASTDNAEMVRSQLLGTMMHY